jgi:pimeloyl-ACP methyl ester carboxylesterase
MWRWTRRALIRLAGFLVVVVAAGATYEWIASRRDLSATPPPGRLIDVGGHRLHIWCSGTGTPAVILESGLGGPAVSWGFVQPEVARFTRVCSYDRAGLGYSDPGPSPRTARRIARELADLLRGSGITDPLVLVGASSGGFSMRIFASEHTERISGLSFGMSLESLASAVRAYGRATHFRAAGYNAAASEIASIEESANEVRTTRRPLTSPVVVITGARSADAWWLGLQRDQVKLSTRGCHILAEQSGHVVPVDQPEVVVSAIRAIVDAARGQSDVPLCGSGG